MSEETTQQQTQQESRNFVQLMDALMKGATLKDFTGTEQKLYLDTIGANNVTNGEVKSPKDGQIEIPIVSVTGKTYNVRLYATENGQVHFQGAPGTNQKFGRSMSVQEIEFYFVNMDRIAEWIDANEGRLARKAADGKVYLNGKEVVKQ